MSEFISAVRSLFTKVLTCPSSLVIGDAVYLTGSDAVDKATSANSLFGVIVDKVTPTTCVVQVDGELDWPTPTLTPNSLYYVSDTPGVISTTPGTNAIIFGLAIDPSTIMMAGLGSSGGSAGGGSVTPFVQEGRLSLMAGDPICGNVIGATSVHWTPYKGNRISLFNGLQWQIIHASGVSVAVPATRWRIFDIFGYLSGSSLALETMNWPVSGSITGTITGMVQDTTLLSGFGDSPQPPLVGTWGTKITSVGHGLAVLDMIGIDDIVGTFGTDATAGLNGTTHRVAGVIDANNFYITSVDTTGLTYVSGGSWFKIGSYPGVQLPNCTRLDGTLVKASDSTRLYLGSAITDNISGQVTDDYGSGGFPYGKRTMVNWYNRILRPIRSPSAVANETIAANAGRQRFLSNNPRMRVETLFPDCSYTMAIFAKLNLANGAFGLLFTGAGFYEPAGNVNPAFIDSGQSTFVTPNDEVTGFGFNYWGEGSIGVNGMIVGFGNLHAMVEM